MLLIFMSKFHFFFNGYQYCFIFTLTKFSIAMKKILYYLAVMLCWALTSTSCKDKDKPSLVIDIDTVTTITVKITKIETLEGVLQVGLYNNEADWDEDVAVNSDGGNEFILKREEAKTREQDVVFEGVPAGIYGISLYQDLDNNGVLNRDDILNLLPQEPYGFSNNVVPSFGPPKFEDCNFEVEEKQRIELTIELIEI